MNKSTFFSGQPIFSQLLKFIPKDSISRIALENKADHYTKRFNTYEHLVTMLYSIFNNCNSLREITTGMLAAEQRLGHLGVRFYPRRSTIADANIRRKAEVFEKIYFNLFKRYAGFLSDSRTGSRYAKLYILDSTTIRLFHEVLRTGGPVPANGKRKGGIKVHTVIRSDQDVPCMIRFSSGVAHDSQYLKEVRLPKGSIIVFDKGYRGYSTFNQLTGQGISWVTKRTNYFSILPGDSIDVRGNDDSIVEDRKVLLGHPDLKHRSPARHICYKDPATGEVHEFFTNNFKLSGLSIASIYRKRWQIELLFKRLKQNYPLKYFLGDSENAIKIQIWCALIADLLIKIVKKAATSRWSFSNLAAMIRLHLMTYIDLFGFLKSPEKALIKLYWKTHRPSYNQLSFVT